MSIDNVVRVTVIAAILTIFAFVLVQAIAPIGEATVASRGFIDHAGLRLG